MPEGFEYDLHPGYWPYHQRGIATANSHQTLPENREKNRRKKNGSQEYFILQFRLANLFYKKNSTALALLNWVKRKFFSRYSCIFAWMFKRPYGLAAKSIRREDIANVCSKTRKANKVAQIVFDNVRVLFLFFDGYFCCSKNQTNSIWPAAYLGYSNESKPICERGRMFIDFRRSDTLCLGTMHIFYFLIYGHMRARAYI